MATKPTPITTNTANRREHTDFQEYDNIDNLLPCIFGSYRHSTNCSVSLFPSCPFFSASATPTAKISKKHNKDSYKNKHTLLRPGQTHGQIHQIFKGHPKIFEGYARNDDIYPLGIFDTVIASAAVAISVLSNLWEAMHPDCDDYARNDEVGYARNDELGYACNDDFRFSTLDSH